MQSDNIYYQKLKLCFLTNICIFLNDSEHLFFSHVTYLSYNQISHL